MRNLEGIVDDVFMVWIIKSLEKYSKADQLVTLPKKRYDKILAQDFIALIKDYGLGVTTTEPLLFLSSKAMSIRGSSYVFSPSEDLALYLKKMIMYCRQIDHCLVLLEFAIGTPQSKKIESFCDAEFVCALWTNFKNEFGIYKLTTETRKQGKVDHLTRILRILINLHGPKYSIKDTKSDIQTLLLYFIICRKSVHEIGNLHEESYFDLQTHLLGLMTNLVENSDKEACSLASVSMYFILTVEMSLDCGTTCVMKCKCRKKLDGLSILAAFFSSAFKVIQEKETDPSSSVFCAYIAILIANIVKHRIDDRPRIMMLLPDKSFDGVIQMLEEFTLFHAAVQEELKLDFEGGNYAQTSLKNLVEILRS